MCPPQPPECCDYRCEPPHPCDLSAQDRGGGVGVILGTTVSLSQPGSHRDPVSRRWVFLFAAISLKWHSSVCHCHTGLGPLLCSSVYFPGFSPTEFQVRLSSSIKKKILLLSSKELHRIQKSVTKSHIIKQVLRSISGSKHTQLQVCGEALLREVEQNQGCALVLYQVWVLPQPLQRRGTDFEAEHGGLDAPIILVLGSRARKIVSIFLSVCSI